MKTYLSTLLFTILTLTVFAQKHPTIWKSIPIPGKQQVEPPMSNNSIIWDAPNALTSTVEHSEYKIKACIKSRLKVDSVVLYLNGKRKLDKGGSDYKITNTCFYFREEITLLSGKNTVRLVAHFKNGSKKESLERIITYIPSPIEGKYYALLIGVQDYGGAEFDALTNTNPTKHAEQLKNTLDDYYFFDEVLLLKDPNRKEVIETIQYLNKVMRKNKDKLLLFFSGHGTENAWHLKGAKYENDNNTSIKHIEVHQYLQKIHPHNLLVIIDACYGSSFCDSKDKKDIPPTPGPEDPPPSETKGKKDENTCKSYMASPSYDCFSSGAIQKVDNDDIFINTLTKVLEEQAKSFCVTSSKVHSLVEDIIFPSIKNVKPMHKDINLFKIIGTVGDFVFLPKIYWITPKK